MTENIHRSGATKVAILTGLSGSGKSTALRALEDAGFYCVDNLPIVLLETLIDLSCHTAGEVSRIAAVVDAREGRFLAETQRVVHELRERGIEVEVVYFDAADDVLVHRYSETRRRHPLAGEGGTVPDGIAAERRALVALRDVADEVVDTTGWTVHELKRFVQRRFIGGEKGQLGVTLVSFGFRGGLPTHADLVFDVRFLPNPFFVPELKPFPGTDPRVASFVLDKPEAKEFLDRISDLLAFLLPRYREEGKSYLTVAIGCTGGKHRSVALATALAARLEGSGQPVRLWHRDVEKE
ncbi:MAG: RNase adapter RapZ [Anaeromyxobacteraceae bacterium]